MATFPKIHNYNGGETMLIHGVGTAKKVVGRNLWKVQAHTGTPWDSVHNPDKKTDVKFVNSKAEAKELLYALHQ